MPERILPKIPSRDSRITYRELLTGISHTGEYFQDPKSVADTIDFGKFVGKSILNRVPQALLVCADGYPYYVSRLRAPTIPIAEIGRFQREQLSFYRGKVIQRTDFEPGEPVTLAQLREVAPSAGLPDWYGYEKRGEIPPYEGPQGAHPIDFWADRHAVEFSDNIWPCPEHIDTANLPNLRDPCSSCTQTGMKPRDVMRLWHDVDLPLVVNGDPRQVAPLIREALHEDEILCNDEKLGFTIQNVGKTFPVDVTVISLDVWMRGLEQVLKDPDYLGVKVPAIKLWLRDEPVNWPLGINFAIGMEPVIARADNAGTLASYTHALQQFSQEHDADEVVKQIMGLPRFHGRIIQSDNVKEGVRERLHQGEAPFVEFVESAPKALSGIANENDDPKISAGLSHEDHNLSNTVTINIDSMDDTIHDLMRGKKGAHEAALAELDRNIAMGHSVKAQITVFPINYATVLESVAELYTHGVRRFDFQYGSLGGIPVSKHRESEHVDPVAWRALVEQLFNSWNSILELNNDPEDRILEFNLPYVFFTQDEIAHYVIGDETLADTYFEHVDALEIGEERPMPYVACSKAGVEEPLLDANDRDNSSQRHVSCRVLADAQNSFPHSQFGKVNGEVEISQDPETADRNFEFSSPYLCPAMPTATGGRTSDRIQTERGPMYHGCREITFDQMPFLQGQFTNEDYLQSQAVYAKMAVERLQRSLLLKNRA